MKPPLFVRELTASECQALQAGLRSREAFTLRRAQILLASADGQRPAGIAARLGCAVGTVRNTLHAFEAEGTGCLGEKKRGPKDVPPILDAAKAEPLKGILHQSPRRFGKPRSTWTLDLLADVTFEQGLTPRRLSHEAIRQAVKRLGHGWKRSSATDRQRSPACSGLPCQTMPTLKPGTGFIRSRHFDTASAGGVRYGTRFGIVSSVVFKPIGTLSSGQWKSTRTAAFGWSITSATPGTVRANRTSAAGGCTTTRAPNFASGSAYRRNCNPSPNPCSATSKMPLPASGWPVQRGTGYSR